MVSVSLSGDKLTLFFCRQFSVGSDLMVVFTGSFLTAKTNHVFPYRDPQLHKKAVIIQTQTI